MDEQATFDGFAAPGAPVDVAHIIIDVDLAHLDRLLDYEIPSNMKDDIRVGSFVRVQLAGRRATGWVHSIETLVPNQRLSAIQSIVSKTAVVTPTMLTVARRIADKFVSTLPQVLSVAIPARHASTEKMVLADESGPLPALMRPEGAAWADHPAGTALLTHLEYGQAPRSVWTALAPTVNARLIELVQATRASGCQVIIVVPTSAQAQRLHGVLDAALDEDVALTGSEVTEAERYRIHLQAMAGRIGTIVGTRSAVWTPAKDLGLIVVWDDGDDRLIEQRSPRCDALDVAVVRSRIEGCALVAAAYTRSVKAASLVRSGWAVSLVDDWPIRRALTPQVRVLDEVDAEAAGPAGRMRIPPQAMSLVRKGLEEGPVLIQVGAAGYIPVVSCARCRAIAHCPDCQGPLKEAPDGSLSCAWCARPVLEWRCRACSGTKLRSVRVGSERTAEEIARAMRTGSVLVSSGNHVITRTLDSRPQIVVATHGAEPPVEGGYAAAVILDATAIAGRSELWAPSEAMRRWFNALALVRPGGRAVIAGGVEPTMAADLTRWDPVDFAERLLDEREALGFFPAATIIALDGAPKDVAAMADASGGEILGTVDTGTGAVRALVRATRANHREVLDALARAQRLRASRKDPLVRISVNPPELF